MKKAIFLTAAVVAFSFVAPQVSNAAKPQDKVGVVVDKDGKYKEIKAEELPEAVTKSIANAYTGYKIDKAYRTEDDSYKVKVAMGDLNYSLFYDEKGELIKVEEPTAEKVDKAMDKSMDKSDKSMDKTEKEVNKALDKADKDVDKALDKADKDVNKAFDKSDKKTSDSWDKTKSSVDTTKVGKSKTSNVEKNNNSGTYPSNTQ